MTIQHLGIILDAVSSGAGRSSPVRRRTAAGLWSIRLSTARFAQRMPLFDGRSASKNA